MATKQDIEKSELRKEIVKLRNENKEYETKLIALLQKKQAGARDEAAIKFYSESKSANDRQIDSKNRQIETIIMNQGKITAPPICYIFRAIIYPPSLPFSWSL